MNTETLVIIIVGILLLGLVWRAIKGLLRLVITLAILGVIAYLVLTYLQP